MMAFKRIVTTRFTSLAFTLSILIIFQATAFAQSQARTLSVELAYSGLTDEVDLDVDHRERNYLLGVGYHISPSWALHTQSTLIRSNFGRRPNERSSAFLFGLTGEYDLVPKSKHRFFLKLGMATGNYCPLSRRLPQIEPTLFYLRYGIGTNISVYKFVQLTLGFESNAPLNHDANTYSYNIISVGLRSNRWLQVGKRDR